MRKGSHHTEATRAKMRGPRPLTRRPRGAQRPALERFEEKVDYSGPTVRPELGPCHLWTGKRRRGQFRYGQFFYRGRWVEAHRFAYERAHGTLPKGQCALHHCDNPQCVREEHLFAGTRAVNVADMDRKRRRRPARGERQAGAKLSYQDADNIRWAYSIGGLTLKTLARWCGVGESTIGRVVNGKNWRPEKQAA